MVDEFWTSIKAYLYDRASSPLLGALVVGLLMWNLKIVMLFFSSTSYAVKIWEIDHFYAQPFFMFKAFGLEEWALSNYICCVYVMPMVTALFYIYVFPYFSHKVFEHSYNKQIDLNNTRKELQGSEILTQDEKAEIFTQIEQLKLKHRKEMIELRDENKELESQLNTVISDKAKLDSSLSEISKEKDLLEKKNRDLGKHLKNNQNGHKNNDELLADIMATTKEVEELINQSTEIAGAVTEGERIKDMMGDTTPLASVQDDSANDETKDNHDEFAFFYNTNAADRERYMNILSSLFLGDKSQLSFSASYNIDRYMPDLMINGLVYKAESGKFSLTNEGREFFQNLKRSA